MARGNPWYYWVDNKWLTAKELGKKLGIPYARIGYWYNKGFAHKLKDLLGYIPERTKKPFLENDKINGESFKKYWIVYRVNNKFKYGLCFGRGRNEQEAINDFEFDRKDSAYTHEVLYTDLDYNRALNYLQKILEEGYDEGYTDAMVNPIRNTGLKDKNNQEIYEGDIVKRISMGPGGIDFVGTVTLLDGMFVLDNGTNSIPLFTEADELVIIDNSFEEENK